MPARAPVPCAVTIHDCTFFDHPEWHVRSKAPFFRRAIRQARPARRRRWSASARSRRTRLRACCDVRAPIVVAPHGVDHERFTADRAGRTGPSRPLAGAGRARRTARCRRSSARSSRARAWPRWWPPSTGWPSAHPDAAWSWPARWAGVCAETERALARRRATPTGSCGPATCPTTPCPRCCARPRWWPTRRSRRGSGCPRSRRWPAARRCHHRGHGHGRGGRRRGPAGAAGRHRRPGRRPGAALARGRARPRRRRGARARGWPRPPTRTWEASVAPAPSAAYAAWPTGGLAVGFRAMRALITGGKGFVGPLAGRAPQGLRRRGRGRSTSRPTWPTAPPCAGSWPTRHPKPSTTWPP